jgi:hypothetical protein
LTGERARTVAPLRLGYPELTFLRAVPAFELATLASYLPLAGPKPLTLLPGFAVGQEDVLVVVWWSGGDLTVV